MFFLELKKNGNFRECLMMRSRKWKFTTDAPRPDCGATADVGLDGAPKFVAVC